LFVGDNTNKGRNVFLFYLSFIEPITMRRILIIAILFISACHNIDPKQERAERLAKAYMNQHLSKYEGVTFSKLNTIRESYIHTKAGIILHDKFMRDNDNAKRLDSIDSVLDKNFKLNKDRIIALRKKSVALDDSVMSDMIKILKLKEAYKGKLQGYQLYYTYKIQDKFEPVYHKMTFKIDTPILHITLVKDTVIEESDVSWN
jgi:hypothetical protein